MDLALALWVGAQFVQPIVVVTVHNGSGVEITALLVAIGGTRSECARLSPNETLRASFEVEGDSSLRLSCTDADAGSVNKSLDVYLMKGTAGSTQVRVEPAAAAGRKRGERTPDDLAKLGAAVVGYVAKDPGVTGRHLLRLE